MDFLRCNGVLCCVGPCVAPINVSVLDMLSGQKTISTSSGGGTKLMKEMLDFAAINPNVLPKIETMSLNNIEQAFKKLGKNQARYRIVLVSH